MNPDPDRRSWKIDLTKDPRWEAFGSLGQETRIQALEDDLIGSYFPALSGSFVQDVLAGGSLVQDVLGSLFDYKRRKKGPKDWEPGRKGRPYGHDDVARIMDRMRESSGFPKFSDLVRDAAHFTVEEAVLPSWSDIEWAFDQATERVVEHESVDRGLWEPIMDRSRWNEDGKILYSLAAEMKLGKDYVVTFDASRAAAVKALEKAYYADPERLSERDMEEGLGQEFGAVLKEVVHQFWRILEKDVDAFDVSNRIDFWKWWKETLKNEDMVAAARSEFVEFLRDRETAQ